MQSVLSVRFHGGGDQGRPDRAGADRIDPNPLADDQIGEPAGEGDHGTLAGGVVEEVFAADVGVDGGAVDDGVTGLHVGEGVFGEEEARVDVDVEGLDPLVSVENRQIILAGMI